MTRYTILIDHTSSDSENSERCETELPITWGNIDRAKEALTRIRDLYIVETRLERDYSGKITWADGQKMVKEVARLGDDEPYYMAAMMIPLDDGTEHRTATFWRGWGERMHCATIIELEDASMRFCPDDLPYDFFDDRTKQ